MGNASANATLIGFLEEEPGVKSMARLTIAQLTAATLVLVIAAVVVAIRGGEHAAGIIQALGVVILGVAGAIVGAIATRNKGVPDA